MDRFRTASWDTAVMPAASDNSSDLPLWLLWAASEYVLATRDTAFLDEMTPTWPLRGPAAGREIRAETAGSLLPAPD